jgi:Flp pilus assembly protein protease CpaA
MTTASNALVLIAVAAGGAAAAAIDLRTRRVPNALSLAIAATGFVLAAAGMGRVAMAAAVGGCLIGVLLMLPGHIFGATGGGDVKLLGALGTLLGPAGTVTAFLAMALVGGMMAIAIAVHRHRAGQADNRFAYAPAIAVGACVAVVGG